MTQDYYKAETTKHYDIPLCHLDYDYIRGCSDVKELEKILRVLRYVQLQLEAYRLRRYFPTKSKALR